MLMFVEHGLFVEFGQVRRLCTEAMSTLFKASVARHLAILILETLIVLVYAKRDHR